MVAVFASRRRIVDSPEEQRNQLAILRVPIHKHAVHPGLRNF
jgi:hypothetical protein